MNVNTYPVYWLPATTFLTGNKQRIAQHKNMLLNYLHKYFESHTNKCYPIFVESTVKFRKKSVETEYPGLILQTDSNSNRGYRVALFEIDNDEICDLHDCPARDIKQFEVANILAATTSHSEQLDACKVTKESTKRQKTFQNDPTTPQSFNHSQSMPDALQWKEATNKEIHGIHNVKKCFQLLSKSDLSSEEFKNVKRIPSVMVYKRKVNSDGTIKSHKARLCAGGHVQKAGDGSFHETYAPTAGLSAFRFAITMAVNLKLKPYQLDVEQAFLNNEMDTKIIMKLPPGITIEDHDHVLLLKGVYGLKQAPNLWYAQCKKAILQAGPQLKCSDVDPCLFHYFGTDFSVIITVTVDDFAVFTDNHDWLLNFEKEFNSIYTITREPSLTWYLGIRLQWSKDYSQVKLDQPNDINKGITFYQLEHAATPSTPMAVDFDNSEVAEENINPVFSYSGIIGRLLWIARISRADIMTAVTVLSSFNTNFTDYHVKAAKRVLCYLNGTKDLGIYIKRDSNFDITSKQIPLQLYSDSDWGRDKIQRRSVTGYVSYLFGTPVTTRSCYQRTIALSSAEAEYMAMADAVKEIMYFYNLFQEIEKFELQSPVTLFVDNTAAIAISKNPICNKRTKHIDLRYHFLRQLFKDKIFMPTHVSTLDNVADIFTKPLAEIPFCKFRDLLISKEIPE